ncbi:MAG: hypothetical protein IJ341_04405 [Bacteroidales bacterium]|nr:hypothetical protein [Bacteroidales bacterium]MBQ7818921.1 hypothetical protein [Bacteroidales bacterium]
MIYKFLLLSDEVETFSREICIDSEATFLELNDAILNSVNYTKDQITSFFICEDDWEKREEITLIEMDSSSDEDIWLMEDTRLSELIEDEHQRLLFVFDMMADRSFFMELREIELGKNLIDPLCTKVKGKAPKQIMSLEELDKKIIASTPSIDLDDDDFGIEGGYNPDELDTEGFSDMDFSDDNGGY